MSEYPELEKLSSVSDESQKIGEFLEWAAEQGIRLMQYRTSEWQEECTGALFSGCTDGFYTTTSGSVTERPCQVCEGTGLVTNSAEGFQDAFPRTEEALASYFDIDLKKVDLERREMLRKLQEQNA